MAGSRSYLRRFLARFASDRVGTISVLTALSSTALIGFAGLGTEASYWYVTKRDMQGAADSAAFTAAAAMTNGEAFNSGTPTTAAKAVTAQYGFTDGTNNVTVTVNNPPATGPNSTNTGAVEVIVSQPQTMLLSALFLSSAPTVSGRAVGASTTSGGNGCILSLDRGNVIDVNDSGTAVVNIPNCSLYVNSDDANGALTMSGTAQINAYSTHVVGGTNISGIAKLNDSNGTYTNTGAPISDPYASVQMPTPSSCSGATAINVSGNGNTVSFGPGTYTNVQISGSGNTLNLSPGTYCGTGITASGGNTVNLSPGTYIINGGQFNVSGSAAVNGDGVTVALTGSGSTYATANVSGTGQINISAPTSGATAGLAFFQDRNAPSSGTDSFSGGSNLNITGAIYFPDQTVNYSGGEQTGGAQCTQLIANKISISGTTNFNNNCANTGVQSIGGTASVALVE